jgi:hypothetical protein
MEQGLFSVKRLEDERSFVYRGKWFLPFLGLIILGIAWRWPTLNHLGDYDRFAFGHLAYSDIVKLYVIRDLAAHHVPYLQQNVEYPVLTGVTMWLTAFIPGITGYFLGNAALLVACGLGCFILLARLDRGRGLTRFALAPGLALYSVLNWDLIALLCLTAALYCMRRDRSGWAGTWLAIGASAKLFPAFVLPVFWAHAAAQSQTLATRPSDAVVIPPYPSRWGVVYTWTKSHVSSILHAPPPARLLLSFTLVTLMLNLPIILISPGGWVYFLSDQTGRGVNPDSIWAHMPGVSVFIASFIFFYAFVGGVIWITSRVRATGGEGWEAGALLSLLLFLLFTKDYSPQYDLWLLPLLALLACPLWLWLTFITADLAYYAAIFFDLYLGVGGHAAISRSLTDNFLLCGAVWWRELVLALFFLWAVQVHKQPWYRRLTITAGARLRQLRS